MVCSFLDRTQPVRLVWALCKTQLIKKGNSFSTTSNCEYHYATMVYSKAAMYSKFTPCSNVPLHCPLCPSGLRGQPQTFWKYNLVHHLSLNHLTENYELPTLSPELLFTSFISKKEEHDMGVPNEKTESWRMTNNMPLLYSGVGDRAITEKGRISSLSVAVVYKVPQPFSN